MGQIFAMLLPCLYRTKIQKFSDIQDDQSLKVARRVKRKSSRKDAVYKAELLETVNEHNEYERGAIYLQPREITLIEKVKGNVVENKTMRPNQECRWIGKRRFPQKKRVKNPNEKQKTRKTGEDAQNSPTAQNNDHESNGLNCKKMDRQPKQHDFYEVKFGAKAPSHVETTVSPTVERNIETCQCEETAKSGSGDHKKEKSTCNSAPADPGLQPLTDFQEGESLVHESHPADFYTATFGAKVSSSTAKGEKTSSTDTSRKKKENKKRSAAKLKIPSFLRRNKNSKGKKKDNIGEGKCKEEDESQNPNQESDNGCNTPEGNVKTICVKHFAASSLTSVDSGSQEETRKPEIRSEHLEQAPQPEVKTRSLTSVDASIKKQASQPEIDTITLASVDAANEEQTLKPEIKTPGSKPEELNIDNKVPKAEIEITSSTSVSTRNDEDTPEPEVKLQGKDHSILESLEKEKFTPSGGDKLVRDDEQSGQMESMPQNAKNEKIKKKSRLFKGVLIPKLKIKRNKQKKDQSAREPEVELQEKDNYCQQIREKGECMPSRRDKLTRDDEQPWHIESISKKANSEKIKKKSRLFQGFRLPKLKSKTNRQKEEKSVIKLTQETGPASPSMSFHSISESSYTTALESPTLLR